MSPRQFGLSLGFGVLLLAANHAAAQGQSCGPHDNVVDLLASSYGEARESLGIAANNAVIEVFANRETGTWTITITYPGGATCLMASGLSFETVPQAMIPPGEPT